MYIVTETLGALRAPKTNPPFWSREITTAELAIYARCTIRAIQTAVDDLVRRKVLMRKGNKWHIPFESWPDLPDRPSKVESISGAEDSADEPADEPTKPTKLGSVAVFERPQRVKAGGKPRAAELPTAASKLRIRPSHEIEYEAHLCEGVLSIDLKVTDERIQGERKRNELRSEAAKLKQTKKVDSTEAGMAFSAFRAAARACGLSEAPADLKAAEGRWDCLSTVDRGLAVTGLVDRKAAGEYLNPAFRPLPQNYLAKSLWLRPIRANVAPGPADANRKLEERYQRNLRLVRERFKGGGATQ